MCGIVGYTGAASACPILLDGLEKLEYRGYDSAGIAVQTVREGKTALEIRKVKGRLQALREMTDNGRQPQGHCGIGHTRWATHGEPSVANAHPHFSADRRIAVVHNGIIENHLELRDFLTRHGRVFVSKTDTETVAHLLDYCYRGDPLRAVIDAVSRLRGSYALGILFADRPGVIYAVRKDSPLIVGKGEGESFIASDVPAILRYTREVCYLQEGEICELNAGSIRFYSMEAEELARSFSTVSWDAEAAEKGGYEHFMLKEIHEQPRAVRDTVSPRIKDGRLDLSELSMTDEELAAVTRVQMVACGSACHVCHTARYIFENLAGVPVDVEIASEFRYRNAVLTPGTLVIAVSQSGETADTLAAVRWAKEKGFPVLAIVNVVGSSIAREADRVMYTWAGPEIAVATTKAYSAQLAVCYLLALGFARAKKRLDDAGLAAFLRELSRLPQLMERLLSEKERLQWLASKFVNQKDVFFIGRGLDYASSMEGSLKLKEISYIHSEAYAAGELKHGTISLIEPGTLVIAVATQPHLFEKELSNMTEVRSRGAVVLGLTAYGNYSIEDTADYAVYVPKTVEVFYPSLVILPLQLLAYYISVNRGLDVDKPRNLAKSVTVE